VSQSATRLQDTATSIILGKTVKLGEHEGAWYSFTQAKIRFNMRTHRGDKVIPISQPEELYEGRELVYEDDWFEVFLAIPKRNVYFIERLM
jgi:hypothetical protein